MIDRIEIATSKNKIVLLILACLAFVVLGLVFLIMPLDETSMSEVKRIILRAAGGLSVVFFGLGLVLIPKKLSIKGPGLVIDDQGITDYSNAAKIGLIEWQDISAINVIQIYSNNIMILVVKNPGKYIERASTVLAKKAMTTNLRLYGSPISLVASSLKISFKELEKLIRQEFEKRKK